MANVSIKFNGKEFLLSCEDGQEEHLEELLIQINQKFNNLKNELGNLGENKLLLITAVKVMDEYYETKKKVEKKKDEFVGYFELILHQNEIEIAYLGLLEEHQNQKLGSHLLSSAIKNSFIEKPERVWVHTCSLDHKNALRNYLARGMKIFKKETINI